MRSRVGLWMSGRDQADALSYVLWEPRALRIIVLHSIKREGISIWCELMGLARRYY